MGQKSICQNWTSSVRAGWNFSHKWSNALERGAKDMCGWYGILLSLFEMLLFGIGLSTGALVTGHHLNEWRSKVPVKNRHTEVMVHGGLNAQRHGGGNLSSNAVCACANTQSSTLLSLKFRNASKFRVYGFSFGTLWDSLWCVYRIFFVILLYWREAWGSSKTSEGSFEVVLIILLFFALFCWDYLKLFQCIWLLLRLFNEASWVRLLQRASNVTTVIKWLFVINSVPVIIFK